MLGMPRLQYIFLDSIPTDLYSAQTKRKIHYCISPFISRLGQLKRQIAAHPRLTRVCVQVAAMLVIIATI